MALRTLIGLTSVLAFPDERLLSPPPLFFLFRYIPRPIKSFRRFLALIIIGRHYFRLSGTNDGGHSVEWDALGLVPCLPVRTGILTYSFAGISF